MVFSWIILDLCLIKAQKISESLRGFFYDHKELPFYLRCVDFISAVKWNQIMHFLPNLKPCLDFQIRNVKFSLFSSLTGSRFVQGTVQWYQVIIYYKAEHFPLNQLVALGLSHSVFTTLPLCQEDVIIVIFTVESFLIPCGTHRFDWHETVWLCLKRNFYKPAYEQQHKWTLCKGA